MQVLAEEDLIKEQAQSAKKAKHTGHKAAELLELQSQIRSNHARDSIQEETLSLLEPRSHEAIVLAAIGDIADRTRMSLYGEGSERAVRVASAKMIYKKALFFQRLIEDEFAEARARARGK